ncbi:MAG: enoyl-CoA hydratase [Alkalicoccus sp.]|nr:MAG: enoyl-CoA hydratase [Alkalicoccus sp.]
MSDKVVKVSVENYVGTITLNRPEAGNAINLQLAQELMEAAIFCSENEEIRAVVLTGVGNKFSVGGDLKSFAEKGEGIGSHLKFVTASLHQAISHLAGMNKPCIGAVNGTAAGGGMSLACACDLVYASDHAKFVTAYNQIGLSPDGSGSYFLPRLVGVRRAMELLYTNRVLDAKEAEAWGLINRAVPQEDLMSTVLDLAEKLAEGPVNAYGATKKLLYHSLQESLETQMSKESLSLAERAGSSEGKEGISAFLEKRQADYIQK